MELYRYSYGVKNIVITAEDNYYVHDGSVNYLYIHQDYRARRMPIIRMTIELDINTIAQIYKHKDAALIKFDLYEYQYDSEDRLINTALCIQHTFNIIPAKDKTTYIIAEDTITESTVDEMRSLQLFEVYLVDMIPVRWFTQEICTNFENASKPESLQALFEMRDIPPGVLIATPPQDNDIIPYTTLPLGDLIGNLEELNRRYGIYDVKPWVYYDFVNLYCINWKTPNIVCPSAKEFGTITLFLMNPVSPDRQVSGSCDDLEHKTHYINLRETPHINDLSDHISATKFATVQCVDGDGNVSKTTLSDTERALAYVYAQNDKTVEQMINENMIGHSVLAEAQNIGISFLKPYKIVTFETGTQLEALGLTGHEYRLAGWSVSILRDGEGDSGINTHNVRLSLIKPSIAD